PEVSYQVAKRAAEKGAKNYHITREWQSNGGTVTITADLFKYSVVTFSFKNLALCKVFL
ncbi:YdgH/BhsA/McbA-like domain containing protein, partial [Proteus mirabilis]|uniref:YdgH/BhsA/McbA-like domain containing protein n=1 Tax=Proteus mirabilis TaxID=584 RepID=UPI0025786B54